MRYEDIEKQMEELTCAKCSKKDVRELEKENAALKQQNAKMRNKLNCAKYHYCFCKDKVCKDCNDWKLETR